MFQIIVASETAGGKSTMAYFLSKVLQANGFNVNVFDDDLMKNLQPFENNLDILLDAVRDKNKSIAIRTASINKGYKGEPE